MRAVAKEDASGSPARRDRQSLPHADPVPREAQRARLRGHTVAAIAAERGETPDAIARLTWDNASRFFGV
jgi:Tat protein secretion system quality control protein TatD with DNase activity